MSIEKHIDILGKRVKDKVTGFAGVVESVAFDLYGCIQCTVKPSMKRDGTSRDAMWFDIARLTVTSPKRVMELPDFISASLVADGKKGPAEKPIF